MASITLTADVTLNGESCDITVYEDTNADGTADNSATQTLTNGLNSYTLSGFSGQSGSDWWLDISPSTATAGTTPELTMAELEVPK